MSRLTDVLLPCLPDPTLASPHAPMRPARAGNLIAVIALGLSALVPACAIPAMRSPAQFHQVPPAGATITPQGSTSPAAPLEPDLEPASAVPQNTPVATPAGDFHPMPGRIPVEGSPMLGPGDAPVTLVIFSDFECVPCAATAHLIQALHQRYPREVRVVYKHFALPAHVEGRKIAHLALTAHRLGKFWQAHELLFELQERLLTSGLTQGLPAIATRLELAPEDLRASLDDPLARAASEERIDHDTALGKSLYLQALPQMYLNGERIEGVPDIGNLEAMVERHLEQTRRLVEQGVRPHKLYEHVVAQNLRSPWEVAERTSPSPWVRLIPVLGHEPVAGDNKDYRVTVVVFANLPCNSCRLLHGVLDELTRQYPQGLRLVFKHNPPPFEFQPPMAHRILHAATRQEHFAPMFARLGAGPRRPGSPNLPSDLARAVGLDLARFQGDLDDPALLEALREDMDLASRLGPAGTPLVAVNGMLFLGTHAGGRIRTAVAEQLREAHRIQLQTGLRREALYGFMVQHNWEAARAIAAPAAAPAPEVAPEPPSVDATPASTPAVGGGPAEEEFPLVGEPTARIDTQWAASLAGPARTRGPEQARVTIVEIADFNCPLSRYGAQAIARVQERWPGAVRHIALSAPGPQDAVAQVAAQVAQAAAAYGAFWPAYAALYEAGAGAAGILDDLSAIDHLAQRLALEPALLREAMDAKDVQQALVRQADFARLLGITERPAYYIDGELVAGPLSPEYLEALIDSRLSGQAP